MGDGPVRSAITHDGSASGLLLLTRARLEVGQEVTINCFLGEGKPTVVRGKVVRQEPLGPEEKSLWRSKVAVEMAEPNADLAKHFEKVSARQAVTYGKD